MVEPMTTVTQTSRSRTMDTPANRPLISWSAVFAGTTLGLGTLVLLTSLWVAMAQASDIEIVQRNLEWFVGASAVLCLLLSGILAGFLSGVRGAGTGFMHGAAIWALLLIITLSIGIPAILNVFDAGRLAQEVQTSDTVASTPVGYDALWGSFWTILGGFLAAGLGGTLGGALTRDREVVRVDDDNLLLRRERQDTPERQDSPSTLG
jgi:hypothetical protein